MVHVVHDSWDRVFQFEWKLCTLHGLCSPSWQVLWIVTLITLLCLLRFFVNSIQRMHLLPISTCAVLRFPVCLLCFAFNFTLHVTGRFRQHCWWGTLHFATHWRATMPISCYQWETLFSSMEPTLTHGIILRCFWTAIVRLCRMSGNGAIVLQPLVQWKTDGATGVVGAHRFVIFFPLMSILCSYNVRRRSTLRRHLGSSLSGLVRWRCPRFHE